MDSSDAPVLDGLPVYYERTECSSSIADSYDFGISEVSTVCRINVQSAYAQNSSTAHSDAGENDALIDIHGLEISLSSRAQVFLAEQPRKKYIDPSSSYDKKAINPLYPYNYEHGMMGYLFPHSYFSYNRAASTREKQVTFDINVCYTDPINFYDEPSVLRIKTKISPDDTKTPPVSDPGGFNVTFHIHYHNYLLLLADQPETRRLGEGSKYNPLTHTLVLYFTDEL